MIYGASFHRITSIIESQLEKNAIDTGKIYFQKTITLIDEKGTKFEICCFSDTEEGLEIKVS